MHSVFASQLPYELQYSILTSVIADTVHSICTSEDDQDWELDVLQTLSVVNKSFRTICISLCTRCFGGHEGQSPIAISSQKISRLRRMVTENLEHEDIDQLHDGWSNFSSCNETHNLFDCYTLLVSFRRLRKSSTKSRSVEEYNKTQQLVITSAKLLSLACQQATKNLGDVGGGLFVPLSRVASQELVLLDTSVRVVNLFHIVENALKFLNVIWKAKGRFGAELVSSMGIIDDGEEEACMDNIKFRLSVIYKSAVRYNEALEASKESYLSDDIILLHQFPRVLIILKKLVEPTVCAKVEDVEMKKHQGFGREARNSVFSLTEEEDASSDKTTGYKSLILGFCKLWIRSMSDPWTTIEESNSEEFQSSYEVLESFVKRQEFDDGELHFGRDRTAHQRHP
ncbi:hypothetical protein VKT23_015662 [Stygiomarasmius scandens]|uniref:F-box protein n=1 Tax=Marasmiellus scandens TaxID=2682957 RepID=A0ABR1IYE2_9AGAR